MNDLTVTLAAANSSEVPAPVMGAEILTRVGGPVEISQELRKKLCLLDNGVLYVSEDHIRDPYVSSFQGRLRHEKKSFKVERVPIGEIARIYEYGNTGTDRERQTSDMQARVVDYFKQAENAGASDIHFRTVEHEFQARFRIHGELETKYRLTRQEGMDMLYCIYQSMSEGGESHFQPETSQDARMKSSFVKSTGLVWGAYCNPPYALRPADGSSPAFRRRASAWL
ncbi:hypothetical protein [Pseudomonas sp. JG-B]|uniref:hypothetical protein n=1 Tax=Pseudomonas sp. JG-B TaxID=2603214 RepID=UPI00129EDBF5|nr:hypothetical protein [Pseudomonas sp. JG-B]MRK19093.1 hypothetical protein [Pseudomonas sp. JG-B]